MLRVLCLSFCFLLNCLPISSVVHFIGLGRDCQVANQLIFFNLRKSAYPLDWMVSNNFYGVIEAFKDDFQYFLDPDFLIYKGQLVLNSYYQFGYNHFFPLIGHPVTDEVCVAGTIVPNFLDYLPSVQKTQGRRINRLLNLLSSKDKIVFIRTHSTPKEAFAFMDALKKKHPKIDALLVVVHERKDLIGEWNIPNVMNFYASQRSGLADWWTVNEWVKIIQAVSNRVNLQTPIQPKSN